MGNGIREPRQERAKIKKDAIIKAAYKAFSEVGYYKTNTADIAKIAGVSTGIVYGYFKDKKDILFYVIKIYIDDIKAPIVEYLNSISGPISAEDLSKDLIDLAVKLHNTNANLHNILHSLADTHNDINDEFMELENVITEIGAKKLEELGFNKGNLTDKVHLIMDLVQSYSHEFLYDNHDYINYDYMKELVCSCLVNIINY